MISYNVNVEDANMTSTNMTNYVTSAHYLPMLSRQASSFGAVLGTVVVALGTFGNVLVILAVLMNRSLLKASNMFIVSLAVCDLFQTIMVRPLFLHTYIQGRWELGPQVCLYALYASNLAILESILHVSAIAFYRYIIIVHPKAARKFQSPKAVVLLILLIYVGPLLIILLPSLSNLRVAHVMYHDVSFNTHIMFCAYNKKSDTRDDFQGSVVGIIKKSVFLLCTASFLFYCYMRIFQVVRLSGRSVNSIQGSFHPTRLQREITLLKTVIVVFLAFVLSYLPVTVIYAMDTSASLPDGIYVVSVILLWCSSSVNWMIYGLMNKQFLVAYRYILCGFSYGPNPTVVGTSGRLSRSSSKELHENCRTFRQMSRKSSERTPEEEIIL